MVARVEAEDVRFDVIWSNPPIHIGKETLHRLLIQWLDRLHVDGVSYLVVQRNLGADSLIAWLNEQGFPSTKIASKMATALLRSRHATETMGHSAERDSEHGQPKEHSK